VIGPPGRLTIPGDNDLTDNETARAGLVLRHDDNQPETQHSPAGSPRCNPSPNHADQDGVKTVTVLFGLGRHVIRPSVRQPERRVPFMEPSDRIGSRARKRWKVPLGSAPLGVRLPPPIASSRFRAVDVSVAGKCAADRVNGEPPLGTKEIAMENDSRRGVLMPGVCHWGPASR